MEVKYRIRSFVLLGGDCGEHAGFGARLLEPISWIFSRNGKAWLQELKSLRENCETCTSAAEAGLTSLCVYVVAKATTYKDSRALTHTLKPLFLRALRLS